MSMWTWFEDDTLTIEFVQEDMRHFQRSAAFDLALKVLRTLACASRCGLGPACRIPC